MDGFAARCQTAETLRNFKIESERSKKTSTSAIDDYTIHNLDGWEDPHKSRPQTKGPTLEERRKLAQLAQEQRLVEPLITTCLHFIESMKTLVTTDSVLVPHLDGGHGSNTHHKPDMTAAEEFQETLEAHDVIKHKTWRTLTGVYLHMTVTQVYSKKSRRVLCCIIPWEAVHELTRGSVGSSSTFCVLVWPDKHVDVYRVRYMRFQKTIGTVTFSESVWEDLWMYNGPRGETVVEPLYWAHQPRICRHCWHN